MIVDLDFQFGDVASALRMTPEHTFADISRTPLTVDVTTVKIFLTASDGGLYALCAPETPVDADGITPQQVQHVVSLLASEFRYVIIDTGSGLDEGTLAVLKLCTDIVVLTSTDVPSVRATRKEVEMLDLLGICEATRHFVVNRADAKVGLPVSEVEATVGMRAAVTIPSSRAVPISVNQGSPVLVSDRRTPVADAMARLVSQFASDEHRSAGLPPAHARPEQQGGTGMNLSDYLRNEGVNLEPVDESRPSAGAGFSPNGDRGDAERRPVRGPQGARAGRAARAPRQPALRRVALARAAQRARGRGAREGARGRGRAAQRRASATRSSPSSATTCSATVRSSASSPTRPSPR